MNRRRVLVLDVVGLTAELLRHAPHLSALASEGGQRHIGPVLPAVTCPVQSTYLTGLTPAQHGSVGNGWYFRDLSEVRLWHQSNRLVAGEKIWEAARRRDPTFTCAQLFWWYNMYSGADYSVTPRPCYPADGRKIPDIYTQPADLRAELNGRLGPFPLFRFWGPATDLSSSRWIADCALHVSRTRRPSLSLVYLPHLDYDLQRLGPDHPAIAKAVAEVDGLCGELIAHARDEGMAIVVLSEYGIAPVGGSVPINRMLRRAGWIALREELGRELLDMGASEAFAVADHQIAHVYVRDEKRIAEVAELLGAQPGIERVLAGEEKAAAGLAHPNAGELVAISAADRWFSYGWWLDAARAPDYARTVDIHRKPGYDPVELFIDPRLRWPKLAVAFRLAKRSLGFRSLMDVIPLDESLVRGSHGRPPEDPARGPLLISSEPDLLPEGVIPATQVRDLLLDHLFGGIQRAVKSPAPVAATHG
jgi:predicted AlkP superfamily pyrophosphatase or phosphodiesterase